MRIESDHFPQIAQQDLDSDERIDGLLKDYSSTIGQLILRAKTCGLNYIADSLEVLWKFLIISFDKLFGIKEKLIRQHYTDEVEALRTKVRYMEEDIKGWEQRFYKMESYYEHRVGGLITKNRTLADALLVEREDFEKWRNSGSAHSKDSDSLVGKCQEMLQNMYSLESSINVGYSENLEQTRIIQTDLLKAIMGLFNKNFKCLTKQTGTQTDLSMCSHSLAVQKYGMQEFIYPEQNILSLYRHPFLSYMFTQNEHLSTKVNTEEQINFIESKLDDSSFVLRK